MAVRSSGTCDGPDRADGLQPDGIVHWARGSADLRYTAPLSPPRQGSSHDMPHTARHTDYMADEIGNARLTAGHGRTFEAGSFQSFELNFTAGRFGMDDTGSIRIVHRFASDMGTPQFSDPAAPNYVTATASNGARLELSYNPRLNMRPWGKTLTVAVGRGFLSPGDIITVGWATAAAGRRECGCRPSVRTASSSVSLRMSSPHATGRCCLISHGYPSSPALRPRGAPCCRHCAGSARRLRCLCGPMTAGATRRILFTAAFASRPMPRSTVCPRRSPGRPASGAIGSRDCRPHPAIW